MMSSASDTAESPGRSSVMETSNFAHVIFQNVGKSFVPQAALECRYTLTPFIIPHPKDWVGIFKVSVYTHVQTQTQMETCMRTALCLLQYFNTFKSVSNTTLFCVSGYYSCQWSLVSPPLPPFLICTFSQISLMHLIVPVLKWK